MSDHEQQTTVYDDPDLGFYDEEDAATPTGGLPARPRRKLLTPVSGGLLAVVLVVGGFIGGVQVQKRQSDGSGAPDGLPAAFAARMAQGDGAGGGVQAPGGGAGAAGRGGAARAGGATAGTVANVKGSTLYVTTADGTTVKVKTNDNSKVTRNASSNVASVHPGDTVIVQGTTASSGTLTASSITATAKGVTTSGFGGGFPGAGATGARGGAPESGTSAPQVPQGFAPPSG